MEVALSVLGFLGVYFYYYKSDSNQYGPHQTQPIKDEDADELRESGPPSKVPNVDWLATTSSSTVLRDAPPSTPDLFHNASGVTITNSSIIAANRFITFNPDGQDHPDIGAWLSPLNFKLNQRAYYEAWEPGTGQWFLESAEYVQWCGGKSETLWCPGIPGAGKTVMVSVIVNHLETIYRGREDVGIVYMYCDYKEQTVQTVTNLIASLLKQLVQDHPATYDRMKAFYLPHKQKEMRPTLEDLRRELRSEMEKFTKVFILVDALDECLEVDGTRARLLTVLRSFVGAANLLITSRNLTSIERDLERVKCLNISADHRDVRKYVESRIHHTSRLAIHVRGNPVLQEEVVQRIIQNVQGMFLLARLHMDSLATTISIQRLRDVLEELPKETDAIYDQTMKRIEEQGKEDRELAKKILSWITYARRSLSLSELQHALAVSPGMTRLNPDAFVHETILTSVCAGLVVIDTESRIVRLVHYTTQEYFERVRESIFPDAQRRIAETCLTYLSFDAFSKVVEHHQRID